MPNYAHIQNGIVTELFTPPAGVPIAACFNPALIWIDVTAHPSVVPGWTYDGTVFAAPVAPTPPPPPTVLPVAQFLGRFTAPEQIAVQTAAAANAQIGVGMTMGLAHGVIDLTDVTVAAFMAALVTAGCITDARRIVILTP